MLLSSIILLSILRYLTLVWASLVLLTGSFDATAGFLAVIIGAVFKLELKIVDAVGFSKRFVFFLQVSRCHSKLSWYNMTALQKGQGNFFDVECFTTL